MAMSNLSIDGQFRYIVEWFNEWSELQRDDFVPVLVEYLTKDSAGGIYMNGIVHSVANAASINDKPMSLFLIRIKLFREWSPKWPVEFKHKLQEKILEIDRKVGEKVINEMKGHNGHTNGNGNVNGVADDDEINAIGIITASSHTEAAAAATNSLTVAAELNDNETPVDDDDDDVDDDDGDGGGGGNGDADTAADVSTAMHAQQAEQVAVTVAAALQTPDHVTNATQAPTNNVEVPLIV